jgi:hypothetical protein
MIRSLALAHISNVTGRRNPVGHESAAVHWEIADEEAV